MMVGGEWHEGVVTHNQLEFSTGKNIGYSFIQQKIIYS